MLFCEFLKFLLSKMAENKAGRPVELSEAQGLVSQNPEWLLNVEMILDQVVPSQDTDRTMQTYSVDAVDWR